MPKVVAAEDLYREFDAEISWRRKELSDLKLSIRNADTTGRSVLLKSLIAIAYSHWEGYVRECAQAYFAFIALRRFEFSAIRRQFYVNKFLARLDSLSQNRVSLAEKCALIAEILDGQTSRFAYVKHDLVDTKSNLNTDVVCEICQVCDVDSAHFEDKRPFIDVVLLKRRNAIAHGRTEAIDVSEIDGIVADTLALMEHFRTLLENKVALKEYLKAASP